MILNKYILPCVYVIAILILGGCAGATRKCITEGPILPPRPAPVVIDNGQRDTSKYPNTKWIKPPKTDVTKGIAWWSYKDIQTLSDALTDWNIWADSVEETIQSYNELLKGGEVDKEPEAPWYKKLLR